MFTQAFLLKTGLECCFQPRKWRREWDSNPREIALKLISSQPRYDRFDTAACLIVVSELTKQFGKRREFMERTPQEMLLQLTPNPLKNQAFLKEAFQLGV